MDPIYTAVATSSGRDSRAVTSDGRLDVDLALPKELGGTGEGTNPEQLLAAGWAACFSTVIDLVAKSKGMDASDVAVTAEVSLVPHGGGFVLAATLRVEMPDHLTDAERTMLLEETHRACPYSAATRGNIAVELVLE